MIDLLLSLVIAMVLHELAHGLVALWLGDDTARKAGRLTLNPLKHIDPRGSVLVPAVLAAGQLATLGHVQFMYGWAKPVPVQAALFAHPRQMMAVVALAGPLTNFALALLGGLLLWTPLPVMFLAYFILVNLTIGMFNLLPIPPFDGGRIAVGLLPLRLARGYARVEKLGIAGVLLILFVLPALCGQLGFRFNPVSGCDGCRPALGGDTGIVANGAWPWNLNPSLCSWKALKGRWIYCSSWRGRKKWIWQKFPFWRWWSNFWRWSKAPGAFGWSSRPIGW